MAALYWSEQMHLTVVSRKRTKCSIHRAVPRMRYSLSTMRYAVNNTHWKVYTKWDMTPNDWEGYHTNYSCNWIPQPDDITTT